MIQSMTGYGKSVLHLSDKKVTIEVKSLNSKNLDLNVRIPSYYREKELNVRKELASKLVRGKVDFSIYVEMTADETSTTVNKGVVAEYMQQLRNVVQTGSSDDVELLKMAVKMPDALKTSREELDENEWTQINQNIQEAIKEAALKSNVDIRKVQVGIAGAHINSLQHKGMIIRNDRESEINKDDLEKLENDMFKLAVKPGDRIIHVLPQDYTVDDEPGILDPVGMSGVKHPFVLENGEIAT